MNNYLPAPRSRRTTFTENVEGSSADGVIVRRLFQVDLLCTNTRIMQEGGGAAVITEENFLDEEIYTFDSANSWPMLKIKITLHQHFTGILELPIPLSKKRMGYSLIVYRSSSSGVNTS